MIDTKKLIEAADHHIKRGDGMMMDPKVVRQLAVLCSFASKLEAAATKLADDVHGLIAESIGVSGLHLNGQVAEWESLMQGGALEGWLGSLDDLDSALADCLKQKHGVQP